VRYLDPHEFIQRRFTGRAKPSWNTAIICFRDLGGSEALLNKLHAVPLKQMFLWGMDVPGDRPYVYEARTGDNQIAIVSGCWWGGPQAAILVEELSCLGVEYIIGFGFAGSISSDLPKGTQTVASRGLVTDGTSRFYTKADSVNADPELLGVVQSVVKDLKHEVIAVTIATVDAIYQETDNAVREWVNLGAQAINMETTPLYAASHVCGVKSIWLGPISDCLIGDNWDNWWDFPEKQSVDDDAIEIAIALVESLRKSA